MVTRFLSLLLVLAPVAALQLSRAQFVRRALATGAAATTLPLRPLTAAAGEPARAVQPGETFYQADDKSFDFIAPEGWAVAEAGFGKTGEDPRRFFPEHLFKVSASDSKSGSSVDVTVDLGYGASLGDLGGPEKAASKLVAKFLPGATVASAEKVKGAVKGSSYLVVTTTDGRALRAAITQKRAYVMTGKGPAADGVLGTLQAWPTNIFCQGASNSGGPIVTGTCY